MKILSELDHPNIVKYLGTECTDGTLRIFLELATDGTIKDALNEFGMRDITTFQKRGTTIMAVFLDELQEPFRSRSFADI